MRKMSKPLTLDQRNAIFNGLNLGWTGVKICRETGIATATLCREMKIFRDKNIDYDPVLAHQWAQQRLGNKGKAKITYSPDLIEKIYEDISLGIPNKISCKKHNITMHALRNIVKLLSTRSKPETNFEDRLQALEESIQTLFTLIKEMKV